VLQLVLAYVMDPLTHVNPNCQSCTKHVFSCVLHAPWEWVRSANCHPCNVVGMHIETCSRDLWQSIILHCTPAAKNDTCHAFIKCW